MQKYTYLFCIALLTGLCSPTAAQWLLTGNSNALSTSRLGTTNAQNLNIWSGGQQRMIIKASNGDVGIGTVSPHNNLHIHGTGNATAEHHGDITPIGTESFLQFTNVETGSGANDGLHIGVLGNSSYFTSNDQNMRMYFINGSASMSLRNEGWIDMFGSSPSTTTKLNLYAGSGSGMMIKKTTIGGYNLRLETVSGTGTNALEVYSSGNVLSVIRNDGKMGIGTATPDPLYLLDVNGKAKVGHTLLEDYALEVVGKVRACEVRVSNPGWCDFVFDPGYPLMSIDSLDRYIQANHHLPEMPSATEVEAEGFDLAKMDAAMLKRSEENTLYIIALEKKCTGLESMILQLQQRLGELEKAHLAPSVTPQKTDKN